MVLTRSHGPSRLAGGYAFFETSSMPTDEDGANTESAMLSSPEMKSTGASGKCLK